MITKKEKKTLIEMAIRETGGCEECAVKGIKNPNNLEIHRIIRGSAGGKYIPRNCMVVCNQHHKGYHFKEPGHRNR